MVFIKHAIPTAALLQSSDGFSYKKCLVDGWNIYSYLVAISGSALLAPHHCFKSTEYGATESLPNYTDTFMAAMASKTTGNMIIFFDNLFTLTRIKPSKLRINASLSGVEHKDPAMRKTLPWYDVIIWNPLVTVLQMSFSDLYMAMGYQSNSPSGATRVKSQWWWITN